MKVRLLKKYANKQKGDIIEIAAMYAEKLIKNKIAEKVNYSKRGRKAKKKNETD